MSRCSVAVQTRSEPEICHGEGCYWRAAAGIRVHDEIQNFIVPAEFETMIKDQREEKRFGLIEHLWFFRGWPAGHRKNRDKPINYTVRVMLRLYSIFL